MSAPCPACRQGRCEDCYTLGLDCPCCDGTWDDADDPEVEW